MIHQSWEIGKAIRPLFAEPVTYLLDVLVVCEHTKNEDKLKLKIFEGDNMLLLNKML